MRLKADATADRIAAEMLDLPPFTVHRLTALPPNGYAAQRPGSEAFWSAGAAVVRRIISLSLVSNSHPKCAIAPIDAIIVAYY